MYIMFQLFSCVGELASHKLTPVCDNSVFYDARHHLAAGRFGLALKQVVKDYR